MTGFAHGRPNLRRVATIASSGLVIVGLLYAIFAPAYGAPLGKRSLLTNDNIAGETASYTISLALSTPGQLASIKFEFCSNDAIPDDVCTAPTGLDLTTATLVTQTGVSGFSIDPSSTANKIILTRTSQSASALPVSFRFDGVKNPTVQGSYFVRLQTYSSNNATGTASDYGGIAFAILGSLSISAEVPPYLIFCSAITIANLNCANATGSYIDFGELSSGHTSTGTSQLLTATNSGSGYSITLAGNTMTSGNNVIPALGTGDVSRPGTGQFGLNFRSNVTPVTGQDTTGPGVATTDPLYSQPNTYRFVSGDVIVSDTQPDNIREYTASYIVNVPTKQAPGIYVSTVTYVCLANF